MTELLLLFGITPIDLFVISQVATLICVAINIWSIYNKRANTNEIEGAKDESER